MRRKSGAKFENADNVGVQNVRSLASSFFLFCRRITKRSDATGKDERVRGPACAFSTYATTMRSLTRRTYSTVILPLQVYLLFVIPVVACLFGVVLSSESSLQRFFFVLCSSCSMWSEIPPPTLVPSLSCLPQHPSPKNLKTFIVSVACYPSTVEKGSFPFPSLFKEKMKMGGGYVVRTFAMYCEYVMFSSFSILTSPLRSEPVQGQVHHAHFNV